MLANVVRIGLMGIVFCMSLSSGRRDGTKRVVLSYGGEKIAVSFPVVFVDSWKDLKFNSKLRCSYIPALNALCVEEDRTTYWFCGGCGTYRIDEKCGWSLREDLV